jgi:hypothetical protein
VKKQLVEGQIIVFTLILDSEPGPEPVLFMDLVPAPLRQIISDPNGSGSRFLYDTGRVDTCTAILVQSNFQNQFLFLCIIVDTGTNTLQYMKT